MSKLKLFLILSLVMIGMEIWLLLEAGARFGVWPALGWVVGSGAAALFILRTGGWHTVRRIHHRLALNELPTLELFDLGLVTAGAVLLLLPGIITDAIGLWLLFPPTQWLMRTLLRHIFRAYLPAPSTPGRGYGLNEEGRGITVINPGQSGESH